jgi:hypothetical protein
MGPARLGPFNPEHPMDRKRTNHMNTIAEFHITGGEQPTDTVRIAVTEHATWFRVTAHYRNGTATPCYEHVALLPAITYAAQLAGYPVKATDWDDIGHADYWPAGIINGQVDTGGDPYRSVFNNPQQPNV